MGSSQPLFEARITVMILIVATVAAAGPTLAARHGICASADVPEPVRLPDGSLQPAGRITLCEMRDYSPVASLHTLGIDGRPVALLISRRGTAEGGTPQTPFLMFVRDRRGNLHLAGYATPTGDGDGLVTYELIDPRPGRRDRTIAGLPPGENGGAGVSSLLLAARVD